MRKLPAAAQEERRRQVIGLRQAGVTYGAIAEQVGLSRTGVFNICQRFAAEMHPADRGDTATLPGTLEGAGRRLAAVEAAPSPEAPAELVADKILCRRPSAD